MKILPSHLVNFLSVTVDRSCVLATMLNKAFELYGINTPLRVQHSISQMAHESNYFKTYSEGLNYTTPERIKATWPTRFKTNAEALPYVRNAEKLANKVYSGRMGNDKPNDGWLLRGSGAIQNTGKENIGAYAKYKGIKDVYEAARLMRETDEYAIDSACWYLVIRARLLDEIDKDDVVAVSKGVNGGTIGLADRKRLLAKAKQIFK